VDGKAVFQGGELGVEVGDLESDADFLVKVRPGAAHFTLQYLDPTAVIFEDANEDFFEGAFPSPGRAENPEYLSGWNRIS
jgi:hypothetical protein